MKDWTQSSGCKKCSWDAEIEEKAFLPPLKGMLVICITNYYLKYHPFLFKKNLLCKFLLFLQYAVFLLRVLPSNKSHPFWSITKKQVRKETAEGTGALKLISRFQSQPFHQPLSMKYCYPVLQSVWHSLLFSGHRTAGEQRCSAAGAQSPVLEAFKPNKQMASLTAAGQAKLSLEKVIFSTGHLRTS